MIECQQFNDCQLPKQVQTAKNFSTASLNNKTSTNQNFFNHLNMNYTGKIANNLKASQLASPNQNRMFSLPSKNIELNKAKFNIRKHNNKKAFQPLASQLNDMLLQQNMSLQPQQFLDLENHRHGYVCSKQKIPKNLIFDKEAIYEGLIQAKERINHLLQQNQALSTQASSLKSENERLENRLQKYQRDKRDISQRNAEETLNQQNTVQINNVVTLNSSKVRILKRSLLEAKEELQRKERQLLQLKQDSKITAFQEMRAECHIFQQETFRLSKLLSYNMLKHQQQLQQQQYLQKNTTQPCTFTTQIGSESDQQNNNQNQNFNDASDFQFQLCEAEEKLKTKTYESLQVEQENTVLKGKLRKNKIKIANLEKQVQARDLIIQQDPFLQGTKELKHTREQIEVITTLTRDLSDARTQKDLVSLQLQEVTEQLHKTEQQIMEVRKEFSDALQKEVIIKNRLKKQLENRPQSGGGDGEDQPLSQSRAAFANKQWSKKTAMQLQEENNLQSSSQSSQKNQVNLGENKIAETETIQQFQSIQTNTNADSSKNAFTDKMSELQQESLVMANMLLNGGVNLTDNIDVNNNNNNYIPLDEQEQEQSPSSYASKLALKVHFRDIQDIAKELMYTLAATKISKEEALSYLITSEQNGQTSIDRMMVILQNKPFQMRDHNKVLKLARYLIEDPLDDSTKHMQEGSDSSRKRIIQGYVPLDTHKKQSNDIIESIFKKIIGNYAIHDERQEAQLQREVNSFLQSNGKPLIDSLNTIYKQQQMEPGQNQQKLISWKHFSDFIVLLGGKELDYSLEDFIKRNMYLESSQIQFLDINVLENWYQKIIMNSNLEEKEGEQNEVNQEGKIQIQSNNDEQTQQNEIDNNA